MFVTERDSKGHALADWEIGATWAKKCEEIRYLRGKSRLPGVAMPLAREGEALGIGLKLAVFDRISIRR